jgi:hypothetical protein
LQETINLNNNKFNISKKDEEASNKNKFLIAEENKNRFCNIYSK